MQVSSFNFHGWFAGILVLSRRGSHGTVSVAVFVVLAASRTECQLCLVLVCRSMFRDVSAPSLHSDMHPFLSGCLSLYRGLQRHLAVLMSTRLFPRTSARLVSAYFRRWSMTVLDGRRE